MRKIMSYAGFACLVLAGTSATVMAQEPSMPHIAMMTEPAGPYNGPTRVDPVAGSPRPTPVVAQNPMPAPPTVNVSPISAGPIPASPYASGQCGSGQCSTGKCDDLRPCTGNCREVHQNYRDNPCIGVRPLGATCPRRNVCSGKQRPRRPDGSL